MSYALVIAEKPSVGAAIAAALGVSTDYILTGDIIDKDKLLLSEKLDRLTPEEVRLVEGIIDECILLYHR